MRINPFRWLQQLDLMHQTPAGFRLVKREDLTGAPWGEEPTALDPAEGVVFPLARIAAQIYKHPSYSTRPSLRSVLSSFGLGRYSVGVRLSKPGWRHPLVAIIRPEGVELGPELYLHFVGNEPWIDESISQGQISPDKRGRRSGLAARV